MPPPGADLDTGFDEDFDRRVGADHRANITPIEHGAGCAAGRAGSKAPLDADQRRPYAGMGGDDTGGVGRLVVAQGCRIEIAEADP